MKGELTYKRELLLFEGPDVAPEDVQEKKKGRSEELLEERNEHILYRNYYYQKYTGLLWPQTCKKLRKQFYLSEITIAEIVFDACYELKRKQIRDEGLSKSQLKKKFEFF